MYRVQNIKCQKSFSSVSNQFNHNEVISTTILHETKCNFLFNLSCVDLLELLSLTKVKWKNNVNWSNKNYIFKGDRLLDIIKQSVHQMMF